MATAVEIHTIAIEQGFQCVPHIHSLTVILVGIGIERLGIGPSALRIGKATQREVDRKVEQLMTDSNLQRQAEQLGQKIRAEQGVCHLCDYIEQTKGACSSTK